MADTSISRTGAFISYSHKDGEHLARLQIFLRPWLHEKHLAIWDDTQIRPGDRWLEKIEAALATARVAILLVSADFLASDFIIQNELPSLLEAAERAGTRILPVVVTPCLFGHTKLSRFQTVNDPTRPLSLMPKEEHDLVWEQLLYHVLEELGESIENTENGDAQPPAELNSPDFVAPELPLAGRRLFVCRGHISTVRAVAWSPDGSRLATASHDQTVRLWDANKGKHLATLKGHTQAVSGVAWSPDGSRLATASDDKSVRLWDPASKLATATLKGHTNAVRAVAWSPDGSRLATASFDDTVRLWDAASGHPLAILTGHVGNVNWVAWSPEGSCLASASSDQTVRLWDAANGLSLATLTGHTQAVSGVAWSPDGSRLASASSDQTVRLWDAVSGQSVATLNHTDAVRAVAWSPDGRYLASASRDKTVHLWDRETLHPRANLAGHTNTVSGVAWSANGGLLASASYDGTVFVWKIE